jgi:hypothetical protein
MVIFLSIWLVKLTISWYLTKFIHLLNEQREYDMFKVILHVIHNTWILIISLTLLQFNLRLFYLRTILHNYILNWCRCMAPSVSLGELHSLLNRIHKPSICSLQLCCRYSYCVCLFLLLVFNSNKVLISKNRWYHDHHSSLIGLACFTASLQDLSCDC